MYEALPFTEDLYDDTSKEYLFKIFIDHGYKRNIHRRIIDDHKVIEFVWQGKMISVPVGNVMVRDRKSGEIKHYEPDEYDRLYAIFDDEGVLASNRAQDELKKISDYLERYFPGSIKIGVNPADLAIALLADYKQCQEAVLHYSRPVGRYGRPGDFQTEPMRSASPGTLARMSFDGQGPDTKDIYFPAGESGFAFPPWKCPGCGFHFDTPDSPHDCDHLQAWLTLRKPQPQAPPEWKVKQPSAGVELTITSVAADRGSFEVVITKEFVDWIMRQQHCLFKGDTHTFTLQLMPPDEPVTSLNPEEEMIHLCEMCRQELEPGHECKDQSGPHTSTEWLRQ